MCSRVVSLGEDNVAEGNPPYWISIKNFVESHISCHNTVVPPRTQDGEDRLNLPSIIATISYHDPVNVCLCDTALTQFEVPPETEYPAVSLVFDHVISQVVTESSRACFTVEKAHIEVGEII